MVGRTEWCDFPAEAAAVPNLGPGINPNLEAILSARPDLVILYNSAQHAAVAARLRELGLPAIRINTDALADVPRVGRAARAAHRPLARGRLDERGVRYRAGLRHGRPRLLAAAQGAAARLGAAADDDRPGQLPERAGGTRGRGESLRRRLHLIRAREHRGRERARSGSHSDVHRRPRELRPAPRVAGGASGAGATVPEPVGYRVSTDPAPARPAAIRNAGLRLREAVR